MDVVNILLVLGAGVLCGFINVLAGSGSAITLPLLIFLGLPANVANGTNRIAILFQNIAGVASFKKQKIIDTKINIRPVISTVAGSILGANIALKLNDDTMEIIIGFAMLMMLVYVLFKPKKFLEPKQKQLKQKSIFLQIIIFFFIGIYGGMVQAGTGVFLLSALVLNTGVDLVKANGLKILIVLLYTPFALFFFIINNQINYQWGLILAAGSVVGALIASKVAVKWGPKFIRYLLIAVLAFSALKLFGIINF